MRPWEISILRKVKSLKETWPYSCGFPYRSHLPVSLTVIHGSHTLLIINKNYFFRLQLFVEHGYTTKKLKASNTNSKQRNTKSTAVGEPAPHWSMALATGKNGQGMGLPWQSPAEYTGRRGLHLQTQPLRSWWVTLPAREVYTQQGPCMSLLETGLQECKMKSIFLSGMNHLVSLVLCKFTWNIWTFQACVFSWQILKNSRNSVHSVNALLLMVQEWWAIYFIT